MNLTREQLESLETPCIVIDVAQAKRNIEAMQRACDTRGVALRPHVKTHKIVRFARVEGLEGHARSILSRFQNEVAQ